MLKMFQDVKYIGIDKTESQLKMAVENCQFAKSHNIQLIHGDALGRCMPVLIFLLFQCILSPLQNFWPYVYKLILKLHINRGITLDFPFIYPKGSVENGGHSPRFSSLPE